MPVAQSAMSVRHSSLPSREYLREIMHYNPNSGVFTWLKPRGYTVKAGSIAGSLDRAGYRTIKIYGQSYKAHRLAWLMHHGEDPGELQINHINSNPADNRIKNLELVTSRGNIQHSALVGGKSNGLPVGVLFSANEQKYKARICVASHTYNLGTYEKADLAAKAYNAVVADIDYVNRVTSKIEPWIAYRVKKATGYNLRFSGQGEMPRGVSAIGESFVARIQRHGVRLILGKFATPEEASVAYENARANLNIQNQNHLKGGN